MKSLYLISLTIMGFFLFQNICGQPQNNSSKSSTGKSNPTSGIKEYKTKTGKIINVVETHPQGASLSDISVGLSGNLSSVIKYKDVDPINKVLVGDLDGNGFDEAYIITIAAGSGSYGNVIGVASLNDKSLSQIFMPPVEEKNMKKGGQFEGYEGHDVYEIKENSLVRTFPIKAVKGTKRAVTYKLKAGEAGFKLNPITSTVL